MDSESRLNVRRRLLPVLLVFSGVLASIFLSGSATGSIPVYRTVVSLTFDDGRASQATAGELLAAHNMHATFYLNSGLVGSTGFLSWAQVNSLAAAGNEIGGHTIDHPDLTTLTAAEATQEVCGDRTALIANVPGASVVSFAYPFGNSDSSSAGDTSSSLEAIVAGCGYTSARITQGILGSALWCTTANCPTAETIPPWDPYDVRATGSVTTSTTLAQLESFVTSAEQNGGGWVPFVFHDVGANPSLDGYVISEANFAAFLDWLSARQSKGTIVRTVGEVMSGAVNPPPPGPNLLQNPSFEQTSNGMPDCWEESSWGGQTGDWLETNDAHLPGSVAVRGEITALPGAGSQIGDQKFIVKRSSECSAPVTPGHSYRLTGWFKGSLSPFFAVYWQRASGNWDSDPVVSPQLPVSPVSTDTWREATWTTPVAPPDATGASVGFAIQGSALGNITIDDLALGDAAVTPPGVQITSPAGGGLVSSQTVTLAASASAGTQSVQFFVDDQPVGTVSSAPFTLSWDSTSVADGSHALTVLATGSDRAQSSDTGTFSVDNTPPTGSLTAPTGGSYLRTTVALSSDSADTGGSGVASVAFQRSPAGQGTWTTIGTATSSPYSARWDTTTVADNSYDLRVVTVDKAGNSYISPSVSVTVDNANPTGSLTRPNPNVFVRREVVVSSDSADLTSGVDSVAFEIAPTSYGPWQTAATVTSAPWSARLRFPKVAQGHYYVRAVTSDRAGNTFVSQARRVGLDNTTPTSSIACSGKQSCRTVFSKHVYVAIRAHDRGSGVRAIRYTTNGKIPTASSVLYRRSLKLGRSRIVRWRVWDRAGNVSHTWSRAIRVR